MEYKKIEENKLGRVGMLIILLTVPIIFFFTGVGYEFVNGGNIFSILKGFISIIVSPTILMTDFLKIGGIAATFINVAFVGFINIYLIHHYKLKINGVIIAAFFTVVGFSFFGKNLYNILPIYLGGYLYTKYQKVSFKEVIVVVMFGTALAPLISELSFSGILQPAVAIIVAIITGIFIGFIIAPLSSHMLRFHDGYNLYNIGFTAGIIGTLLTSILRSFGIIVEPVYIISNKNQGIIIIVLLIFFFGLMILGLAINHRALIDYHKILSYRGRLITDFTHLVGYGITFLNMSILGFLSLFYILIVGGKLNGPALAGVFTVVGFGAFGKHIKNCFPVVLGVIATAIFFGYDISTTEVILAVLFSTTLAPIAGTYGPVIGFIAGVLHMVLVMNVVYVHGGINLYNNGFSGGIVASILIPIVDAFKKERRE